LNIEFKPSCIWTGEFKKRSGLVLDSGEATSYKFRRSGNLERQFFGISWPKIFSQRHFNVDAYALFCTLLPDKTYTFQRASC